jgi:predicted enzyme related to lactoylglutathione lyase
MIIGSHFLLYSEDAERDRAFFRDVLMFPCIDAGEGWLIFSLSPAEAGIHPLEGEPKRKRGEARFLDAVLYLMSDDLDAEIASLKKQKVKCSKPETAPWGRVTTIPLPSGGKIGLYQPRHKTALNLGR